MAADMALNQNAYIESLNGRLRDECPRTLT